MSFNKRILPFEMTVCIKGWRQNSAQIKRTYVYSRENFFTKMGMSDLCFGASYKVKIDSVQNLRKKPCNAKIRPSKCFIYWVWQPNCNCREMYVSLNKKSTFFTRSLWNLVKITYPWVGKITWIKVCLGQNCGFFDNTIF